MSMRRTEKELQKLEINMFKDRLVTEEYLEKVNGFILTYPIDSTGLPRSLSAWQLGFSCDGKHYDSCALYLDLENNEWFVDGMERKVDDSEPSKIETFEAKEVFAG